MREAWDEILSLYYWFSRKLYARSYHFTIFSQDSLADRKIIQILVVIIWCHPAILHLVTFVYLWTWIIVCGVLLSHKRWPQCGSKLQWYVSHIFSRRGVQQIANFKTFKRVVNYKHVLPSVGVNILASSLVFTQLDKDEGIFKEESSSGYIGF